MSTATVWRPFARLWPLSGSGGLGTTSTGFALSRADWRLLAVLFLASRVAIAAGLVFAYLANTSRVEAGFGELYCNWDCDWYVDLAEKGYHHLNNAGSDGASSWAFFPLLPSLMWALSQATGLSAVYSGLVIAQIGWGAGLYLMFLIGRDMRGGDFSRHAAIVYAVWPFAVHSSIPMTEAIFVPLTIGAFLFARRGNWLIVAVFAACLSATRTVGLMIVLPMLMLAALEFGFWRVVFLRPGTERVAVALGAAGLGLGLYMVYLNGLVGDALAFSHNQVAWNRKFELPWMTIIDELNPAFIGANWLVANALDIASGLAAFALSGYLWRRGARPEALFAIVTLIIAFDSGNASSLPRYAGGLFPIILAVAFLSDAPLRRIPAYTVMSAGMISLAFAWGMEQFYVM